MSFALAVLGGLAGGGRALKGIALAKAQAESDLAVEQEKTKAELAKIEADRFEKALEKQEALDKEVENRRQTTVDTHNNLVTDGRHLHTYSLDDYKIFGQNAGLFDQTATVDLESNYGQTLQGVLETGQRYSFLAEGDDPARAENRFFQELTEPVIINNSTRTKQWELPYVAHERMKKRFGPTPTPEQQELLDKSEAEYKRVFSGLASMYTDIIDKRAKLTAEIQLGGEGGRAVTPGAYNVLFSEAGIKEIFNNSPVPNEIINKHVILPALNTTRKVLEDQGKTGYLLKLDKTGEATGSVIIPSDISNDDVNEVINEKENAGASATDANNATADSIAAADAMSKDTGGKLTPRDALKQGVNEFEKMMVSTDEQTGLPITRLNANKATGLLRFEVNVELGLKNPDAIDNYQTALRVVVGNGTIGIETGLPRYLGMQEVVANTIRQKLVEQTDPNSNFVMDYQDTEFSEFLPTLKSLNRSELTNQIVTVEDSLTMANELLSQTTAYLEAQATGAALPFNTGFSQRLFAAKQGGIQQLKQLGFRVDDAGSFLEYADGGTDEELFNYMTDLAEEAGFRVDASTGELIPPSNRTYVGAYRRFLEVQFIYMLARSLENPEGGGARLSVADIENMRDAFGSGGFLNDPGLQLMALQRMTQNFSLQYFHLKALQRSTSPVQYAAAMHLADNQRFKGFKINATAAEKQEVIVDFFTEAIGRERGPMIDEIGDEAPYNPYEQNEGGSTDDSEQPYTPNYIDPVG